MLMSIADVIQTTGDGEPESRPLKPVPDTGEREDMKMERTLRSMPYAQAKVRNYADVGIDRIVLQSYRTDVIIIDRDWLECTGLYSMTTRKHISAFMREYGNGFTFQDVKKAYEGGYLLNIATGEMKLM